MSAVEIFSLALAAAGAGAVNAIAGGGTLITFPVLLFFGTPPVVANATSTVALVFGIFGSFVGYRRQIAAVRPWLVHFAPASLVGGLIGSILLTRTSNETFGKMVPFLILFATILFFAQGAFRRVAVTHLGEHRPPGEEKRAILGAILFQFAVAVYGGYFGAGIGILMLASLGFIGLTDIHEMNGLKTVLGQLINVVAAAWFVYKGLIDWPRALIMTAGAAAGYLGGSYFSQRIPPQTVRHIITAIGAIITVATFWKQFR